MDRGGGLCFRPGDDAVGHAGGHRLRCERRQNRTRSLAHRGARATLGSARSSRSRGCGRGSRQLPGPALRVERRDAAPHDRPSAGRVSACASSIDDEWLFTPIPRSMHMSRASLLVSPNSRASSSTRIFLGNWWFGPLRSRGSAVFGVPSPGAALHSHTTPVTRAPVLTYFRARTRDLRVARRRRSIPRGDS